METKDQKSQSKRIKWAKRIDITLFILCSCNLILWLMRGAYILEFETSTTFEWVYNNLFSAMVIALFLLPTLVVMSTINRKIRLDSFTFLSFKCLVITFILILILK